MTPRRLGGWSLLAAAWLGAALPLAPAHSSAQADVAAMRDGNRAHAESRLDEAVAAYRRALDVQPDSAIARFNLGTALAAAGRTDGAVEALSAAVDAFTDAPRKAAASYNLGNVLARAGRFDEALAAYRASLRVQQDDDARFNHSLVWRWRQAQGEGPAPEEPLTPQRAQELRDAARALDVPVVPKPADRSPVDIDR